MARDNTGKLKLPAAAQVLIVEYAKKVLHKSPSRGEVLAKMSAIDTAYARYKATQTAEDAQAPVGNVFSSDEIVAPIVVSQVDSYVAYLSDVFLSGFPLFPVVSTPKKKALAEQLESLLDDHSIIGGYARQLLLFIRDGVKYNLSAMEADWDTVTQVGVVGDFSAEAGKKVERVATGYTRLTRLDMYNTIWDDSVAPGDVALKGDYAGYVEVISRTKLKRLCNHYTLQEAAYNVTEVLNLGPKVGTCYYELPPTISNYVSSRKPKDAVDWDAWFDGPEAKRSRSTVGAGDVEIFNLYARIIPSEFGIIGPQPNTPQIWKFVLVNGETLLHAKRVISPYDMLPILFGQPLEDGMKYQTQSVAEVQIPIQAAATTLFNMRFSAARRAVSDRALYDPTMIDPRDINSKSPAPKIPVKINALEQGRSLDSAYKQIPFDLRGTETAFQDASVLVDFSKQLSGLNSPQQGQFQKGNKSVQEWQDTMGGSDSRLRLAALCLEYQVFIWLKSILALNIYQYGENAKVVSQKSGEVLEVDIQALRKEVLSFRVADGYTPKSKMASTEMLVNGMTLLMNSPALQQAYGPMLPAMFAHMMQLGGVKGLDEYAPAQPMQPQQSMQAPALDPQAMGQAPEAGAL